MSLRSGLDVRNPFVAYRGLQRAFRWIRQIERIEQLKGELERLQPAPIGRAKPAVQDLDPQPTVPLSVAPFLSEAPPGHFYSPIPDLAEIEGRARAIFDAARPLPGLDLRESAQLANFATMARLARERPLSRTPGEPWRYGVVNPNYGIGDASMLQAMLYALRPKRYLEVGSGYSTALAVDTSERYLDSSCSVTAIEPYPELVRAVLRDGDLESGLVDVIDRPVQDVAVERFEELEANDVLFIDSSHVVKTGSDVHYLYTSVLPVLRPGVYVHIHDIFWPFEYLRHWVEWGRAWSECYLLHAFLLFNDAYEIVLWNHYLAVEHRDLIREQLPAMLENTGGAFWMRRK